MHMCLFGILAARLSSMIRCRSHDDNDSEFISSPLRGTDSAPRRICMMHHCRPPRARDRFQSRPPLTYVKNLCKQGLGDCSCEKRNCATLGVTTQCSNRLSRRRPAHDMFLWFCGVSLRGGHFRRVLVGCSIKLRWAGGWSQVDQTRRGQSPASVLPVRLGADAEAHGTIS